LFRGVGKFSACVARYRLGEIEEFSIFALAEILRLEKFRQTYDVSALASSVGNEIDRLG
jgi:hypothetical protein